MKKLLTFALTLLLALPAAARVERPRLVVGIVVDQMRWDYLYYYYDQYRADGLRRLLDGGFSFENCLINYLPTVTSVGHSSIYTGSVPALTGIVSNNFTLNGRWTYCCADTTVRGVGASDSEALMSPRNLLVSGLGDQLKVATDFRARVIGVALKDRAAILPAGHGADAAYWWDTKAGHVVSSTYYMQELPEWVKALNRRIATKPGTDVKTSVAGVAKTFEMANAALDNEPLGRDSITDLLTVSVSSTDAIGHRYGTRGQMNRDAFMELDRQVAQFLRHLDERVGEGEYLVFLSADHGAAHNHNFLTAHRMPAGGMEAWERFKPAGRRMEARLGFKPVILRDNDNMLYLNHEGAEAAGRTMDEVKRAVAEELLQDTLVMYVLDPQTVLTQPLPQRIREMVANGWHRGRSGDLYYVARANWTTTPAASDYTGTAHNEWNPYDAHIPFLLYGWHVPQGQSSTPTHITDIAPTICEMLHIQMPSGCVGDSKTDWLK